MTLSAAARRTGVDMSEKAFQAGVLDYAERTGWKTAHFHSTIRHVREKDGSYRTIGDKAAAGFPDLILTRRERLVFAELKREKGRPAPSQIAWIDALMATSAEVYLWFPRDWTQIESTLR